MKILIADDDPQILRALRIILGAKGYRVITAANGAEAVSAAVDEQPDMFLLDLGMPQLDGIEVIQGIRGWSQAPILVVSGRTGAADKVQALDTGADDYITKPFDPRELLLRIGNIVRRRIPEDIGLVEQIVFGPFIFLIGKRELKKNGEVVKLTDRERDILVRFARNPGETIARHALVDDDAEIGERTIDVQINRLRRKLEADPANPRYLQTVRGMGYRLSIE